MTFEQFWQLVITKVRFNLKSEASKSYLSYLWWVIEPALYVGTFYLVFAVFMNTRTAGFVVFLCCGNIPFTWFSRTMTNACGAITDGKGLMNQVHIPKIFFPAVIILQDFFKTTIVYLLLLVFVVLNGYSPTLVWLALPVLMLAQLLFISVVAIIVAMVIPFIPDLKFLVTTGVMMMMFGSGIFYDYKDVVLPEHRDLFLLNPMAKLVSMYRGVLIEGVWPNWYSLFALMLVSTIGLIFVLFMLKRLDSTYPRLVLE